MPIRPARVAALALVPFLLAACGAGAPAAPTAAPATPAPTAAPATPAPTAAPAGLLPAPLYVLDSGQIWRIERDGITRHQLTYETRPILDFDLWPANNGLVYLLEGEGQNTDKITLIALDEGGRTELFTGPLYEVVARPGSMDVAFTLTKPLEGLVIGAERGPAGVWGVERTGGRPFLLQANDPPADPAATEIYTSYTPLAWSPDGERLLMSAYPGIGEGGVPIIKRIADQSRVVVDVACCGGQVWAADGATLFLSGGLWVQDAALGLWRVDAATGAATELLPSTIDNKFALIGFPHPAPAGAVDVFMALAADPPEVAPAARGPLIMTRVAPDGSRTPLRPNDRFDIFEARWAPDGSGAVAIESVPNQDAGRLIWLPADGDPAAPIGAAGRQVRWGAPAAQPRADACGSFAPLAFQEAAARRADPAVADVQRRLQARGDVEVGAADGLYGEQTRAAVERFQRAVGLPPSGQVDCATWQAIFSGT